MSDLLKGTGYQRKNGKVGIRNHVLVLSATHGSHQLAAMIGSAVEGTKVFIPEDEDGRTSADRETISRVLIGLGCNPNVYSVLIVCTSMNVAYRELSCGHIAHEIAASGKRVEILSVEDGGFYTALGKGIKVAREMVLEASQEVRTEIGIGDLFVGIKCGLSDATSGMAGNPCAGYLGDAIVRAGGTFLFSETTEVIGAEHIIANRCINDEVRDKFLQCVYRTEEEAKATGEDIRTINPIPANIEAGITTLEEKSLGAVIKAGTAQLKDVIAYGQRVERGGLYFMDSWMSSTSLFLGYAAAGAVLVIFQMGGGALPPEAVMPAINTGIVAPVMYMTGNPRTYEKLRDGIDFNAGPVISEGTGISETGEALCSHVMKLASGMLTKAETWRNYQDRVEIYLKGPAL